MSSFLAHSYVIGLGVRNENMHWDNEKNMASNEQSLGIIRLRVRSRVANSHLIGMD